MCVREREGDRQREIEIYGVSERENGRESVRVREKGKKFVYLFVRERKKCRDKESKILINYI